MWVDADACPVVVKDILFRAAQRTGVALVLVANHSLRVPRASNIRMLQVPQGFDVADHEIVQRMQAGDLVISADIPLAADVIGKGGHVISPRGETLTTENIGARLNVRDFMDTLRASGIDTGGLSQFGQRERQDFANALDRWLAHHT
ncbi:MAG: YaiI/YqxD family protein [Pseudomonadota bacterium]